MNQSVASIERSPAVVALDGPFRHDNVYVRGVRLHLAVAGAPENPLILLIHGAFGGWFDYRELIGPLAELGFHVAAMDMRGYGMSDKPPGGYDLRHAAGDINGVIGALGHDDALIIGSDTGASAAWTTATMYPDRVRGLISLGTVHPTDLRRAIRRSPHLFLRDLARITFYRLPLPLAGLLRPLISRAAHREVLHNTTASYQCSNAFTETIRLRQKALDIDHTLIPVVRTNRLLAGSGPTPARQTQKLRGTPVWLLRQNTRRWDRLVAVAGERVPEGLRVISLPGASDLPFLENPTEFAARIAAFPEPRHN